MILWIWSLLLRLNVQTNSLVYCVSGAGEGRRQSGCRRPADGHDRHEDGGARLLPAHTHPHLHLVCHRYAHSPLRFLIKSFFCLCSTRSGRPSRAWSRRCSSARALRPIATLLWSNWKRRRRRRGRGRGAASKTRTHKYTLTGRREPERVTVTTGGKVSQSERGWCPALDWCFLKMQVKTWIISLGRVWCSLERMRQELSPRGPKMHLGRSKTVRVSWNVTGFDLCDSSEKVHTVDQHHSNL